MCIDGAIGQEVLFPIGDLMRSGEIAGHNKETVYRTSSIYSNNLHYHLGNTSKCYTCSTYFCIFQSRQFNVKKFFFSLCVEILEGIMKKPSQN